MPNHYQSITQHEFKKMIMMKTMNYLKNRCQPDYSLKFLTHWGQVTHICVGKLTIIGSDNGLSPGQRQAIIWTNAGILLIWPLGTNFSESLTEIQSFHSIKRTWKCRLPNGVHLSRPQCVKSLLYANLAFNNVDLAYVCLQIYSKLSCNMAKVYCRY